MGLKTFNINEAVYKEFSKYCRKNGISMSKRVDNFFRGELERLEKGSVKSKKVFEIRHEKLDSTTHSMTKYC